MNYYPYPLEPNLSFIEAVEKGVTDHPYIEHSTDDFLSCIIDNDPRIAACMVGFALLGVGFDPLLDDWMDFGREVAIVRFPELETPIYPDEANSPTLLDILINWNDLAYSNNIHNLIKRYKRIFGSNPRFQRHSSSRTSETIKIAA